MRYQRAKIIRSDPEAVARRGVDWRDRLVWIEAEPPKEHVVFTADGYILRKVMATTHLVAPNGMHYSLPPDDIELLAEFADHVEPQTEAEWLMETDAERNPQ